MENYQVYKMRLAGSFDIVADLSALLLDQAHILDGEVPQDPAGFARRLNALVVRGLKAVPPT